MCNINSNPARFIALWITGVFCLTAEAAQPIFGEWVTPDGSVLLALAPQGDSLTIQIARRFEDVVLHPKTTDDRNPDRNLRNRRLVGMHIGHSFVLIDGKWQDGQIYDPQSGRTYRASLRRLDENHLLIRGYIGFELFGRSQIWTDKDFFLKNLMRMMTGEAQS